MPKSGDNAGEEKAAGEIMLFGVRVKVDPMRKSVSLNNLCQYVQPNESPIVNDPSAAAGGYASADEAVHHQSSGNRERKRGVPWTEEEHKLFLLGLQKVGKGDWRGISRNFVKTRTPTQVASHAQKYYLRRSNLNRRRRRSSLFDITTDTVTAIPMEEEKGFPDGKIEPLLSPETSSVSGSQVLSYPLAVGSVLVPVQIENPMEKLTLGQLDHANNESANLIRPIPVLPIPNPKIMTDIKLNQRLMAEAEPEPLSLQLSLSADLSQLPRHSAFQVLSSVSNGDSIISVA